MATKSASQAYPEIIKMSASTVNSDKICFPSLAGYHQTEREPVNSDKICLPSLSGYHQNEREHHK